MYHSITIGEKNTYDDWHLVASERPVVVPAAPKMRYIDIPGANGSIDLTDALAGRASFSNREGSFEFYVLNDYPGYDWATLYREIAQYLHGKKFKMTLEDDPNYYYEGRFAINAWKSQPDWSRLTIDYNLDPHKYWQGSGTEPTPAEEQGSGLEKAELRQGSGISYHSVVFGDMNTYDDWHLVASERPTVAMPKVKTQYYDAPGSDGQIDVTNALSAEPAYSNREGSFEFYVLNDDPDYNWVEVYDKILNYLHGKKMRMILEDDPEYYYKGRFAVEDWKTQPDWSRITISYNLEPFKYYVDDDRYAILDWEMNPILDNKTDKIYSSIHDAWEL